MAQFRKLRDREGSALVAIPPNFLEYLGWGKGEQLALTLHEKGIWVVKPQVKKAPKEETQEQELSQTRTQKKHRKEYVPSWRKSSKKSQSTKSTDQKNQSDQK